MTSHLMYSQNYYSPVYFAPPPHQSLYYPPSTNAHPIGKRKTLQLKGNQKKENLKNPNSFSILSYNILADTYANPAQHRYCPIEYLNWNWRRNLLNKEIKQYSPDFLCLQEVDRIDDLVNDFSALDKQVNYAHVYAKRPGARPDGCATFYNSNRFELIDKKVIIYNELANEMSLQYIPQVDVRYRRNNIALITLFRIKNHKSQKNTQYNNNMVVGFHNKDDSPLGVKYASKTGAAIPVDEKYLCIVNTHLHWSPCHPDVKLCQTDFLLKAVSSFVAEAKVKLRKATQKNTPRNGVKGVATTLPKQKATNLGTVGGKAATEPSNLKTDHKTKPKSAVPGSTETEEDVKIPVVISGDFNSLPDSEVYQYISQGELHSRTLYLEGWTFKHNLPLDSCYSILHEPTTNITFDFVNCIDYIWYDKTQLEVIGLLSPEYEGEVSSESMKILPNQWFPSDHVCLMSHMSFK